MMLWSDLLLNCFQSLSLSFLAVTGLFFNEYTSVFQEELVKEMKDLSESSIISSVLSRAFSQYPSLFVLVSI